MLFLLVPLSWDVWNVEDLKRHGWKWRSKVKASNSEAFFFNYWIGQKHLKYRKINFAFSVDSIFVNWPIIRQWIWLLLINSSIRLVRMALKIDQRCFGLCTKWRIIFYFFFFWNLKFCKMNFVIFAAFIFYGSVDILKYLFD